MQKIVIDDYIWVAILDGDKLGDACQRLLSIGRIKASHRAVQVGKAYLMLISSATYYRILEDMDAQTEVCLIFRNGKHTISHYTSVEMFSEIKCVKPLPKLVELQSMDTVDWVYVS